MFLEVGGLLECIAGTADDGAGELAHAVVHELDVAREPVAEGEHGAAGGALGVALALVHGAVVLGGVALLAEALAAHGARVRAQLQVHGDAVLGQVAVGAEAEAAGVAEELAGARLARAPAQRLRFRGRALVVVQQVGQA